MSYDIGLHDPITHERLYIDSPHHMAGGTYATCGTTELWLNITWNYADYYYQLFGEKGIRMIYGLSGAESIPVLDAAISQLKDDIDEDYWVATEGNAKRPLCQLRAMAQLRPDGIWDGD